MVETVVIWKKAFKVIHHFSYSSFQSRGYFRRWCLVTAIHAGTLTGIAYDKLSSVFSCLVRGFTASLWYLRSLWMVGSSTGSFILCFAHQMGASFFRAFNAQSTWNGPISAFYPWSVFIKSDYCKMAQFVHYLASWKARSAVRGSLPYFFPPHIPEFSNSNLHPPPPFASGGMLSLLPIWKLLLLIRSLLPAWSNSIQGTISSSMWKRPIRR